MDCSGVTLFDSDSEAIDICDDSTSQSTKEKVATAKAYFAEYYFDLIDYLGAVSRRHELETPPEVNELRIRRFTSMSVPPLFKFGKDAPISLVSTVKRKEKKRPSHASSLVFEDSYSSGPSSPSSPSASSSPSRGDTLRNLNKILSKAVPKEGNKRKAYTLQFQESDKVLLEETKKKLAEKEHMSDVADQLGKSLSAKVEDYEQQKHTVLTDKVLVLESQNVRLEEELLELHTKHKEEREKVKPMLMRHRSLRSNITDLELLKDEIATSQAAENTYKRQIEIATKKNHDLEKEIERLKKESKLSKTRPLVSDNEDLMYLELGVTFGAVVSHLELLLHKMMEMEKVSTDTENIISILANSARWIEDMSLESRPLAFASLASKLKECGILHNNQTASENTSYDDSMSQAQMSTLLLMCIVLLQMRIQSSITYEEQILEWKNIATQSEIKVQELRAKVSTMERDSTSLQSVLEDIKRETELAADKEKQRRNGMVDVEVNTDVIVREHKTTSTDELVTNHVNLKVNHEVVEEIDSHLIQPEKELSHKKLELEQLIKELDHLKEELHVNGAHSQRVIVTPWEKNYHSELQAPLLQYINVCLHEYPYLSHVLPANPDLHINRATYDGVLLCTLVNFAHPGILDERVVNFIPTSDLEVKQNFVLTINTAMTMGCIVPTTNPDHLLSNPHFMLDLLYQLVKCKVLRKINVENHPELTRLRKDNESPAKFHCISPSDLIQRWAEHHHKASHSSLPSISSQPLLATDFHCILSSVCNAESTSSDWITDYASRIGLQRPPLISTNLVGNIPLQSLFFGQILHTLPSLEPLSDREMKIEVESKHLDADPEGTREERAFVTWINGLGIPIFVSNLQHDMNDGLVLLHTLDKIERGCINWKEVNKQPNNAYKKAENCNLGLKTCVSKLNFSLVGIGGKDILDGNRKFILAVVWQACKYHLLSALRTCGDGVEVTESDVLSFLNKRITHPISSFKDPSLKTGLPLLDLLLHIAPEVVKQENIQRRYPLSPEDCLLNAKYAIGLARKIFVLPSIAPIHPPPLSLSISSTLPTVSTTSSTLATTSTLPPTGKYSPRPSSSVHPIHSSHNIHSSHSIHTNHSIHSNHFSNSNHSYHSNHSSHSSHSIPSSPSLHSPRKLAVDVPLCLPILPEDIVELNPKMLFIFVAMMMLVCDIKK